MHIVLALDDSKNALGTAEFLAKLPFRELPRITVVTALVSTYDLIPRENVSLVDMQQDVAKAQFEKAKQILKARCSGIELVAKDDHPNRLILDVARKCDADLIVLGAHGHSALYQAVLGSTADFVVNQARCPILVVRPPADAERSTAGQDFRIMLAYDGTPAADRAVEHMKLFDWPIDRTQIHLATMLERPKLIPEDEVYDESMVAECDAKMQAIAKTIPADCSVTFSTRETLHIGNALKSTAEKIEANLVFVGVSGKSAWLRFFLGSTSRFLLHHLHCSTWVSKEKGWAE